jgi:tripartite-type tricarboxylate transporter receptor subunit TctC
MIGAVGNLGINAFFYKQLGYDPLHDLAPVTLVVSGSNVLVVHHRCPRNR